MPIKLNEENGGKILAVHVSGKLVKADYEHFVPEFERLVRQHGKLRVLFDMTGFHGWTAGALWEDTKFAMHHFSDIERLAVVGEKKWQHGMATFCKPFTKATIQYFDHRKPLDVGEVFHVELDVLPHRPGFPAVETGHVEQHAQFSMLPDKPLELGHKVLVICFCQLPADVNDENLPAVFFIELNVHFGLFWFLLGQLVHHVCSRLSAVIWVQTRASFSRVVSLSALHPGSIPSSGSPASPGRVYQCNACAR